MSNTFVGKKIDENLRQREGWEPLRKMRIAIETQFDDKHWGTAVFETHRLTCEEALRATLPPCLRKRRSLSVSFLHTHSECKEVSAEHGVQFSDMLNKSMNTQTQDPKAHKSAKNIV